MTHSNALFTGVDFSLDFVLCIKDQDDVDLAIFKSDIICAYRVSNTDIQDNGYPGYLEVSVLTDTLISV